MPKCGCAGQTCGCKITNGTGVSVTGTGTAANPYKIAVDPFSLGLGQAIKTSNSNTMEFSTTGSGGTGDPIIISGDVTLRDSNGGRWRPSISTAGAVTYTKL